MQIISSNPYVIAPLSPSAHTQYKFKLKVSSTATPAKYTEKVSQDYTLIFGCPPVYTDVDPSALPWTLSSTQIKMDYTSAPFVYQFSFPTAFKGPSYCTHSWIITNINHLVAGTQITNGPCGTPSSSCTSFTITPSPSTESHVTFDVKL